MSSSVIVVGNHVKVVDVPGHFSINELVGGVATKDDSISVAHVNAAAGQEEPLLTMQYKEWLCVLKGQCVAKVGEKMDSIVVINAGETAFITKGTTWKPTFPVATEYLAICDPAFRPDRCTRVGENNVEGMEKLRAMHAASVAVKSSSSSSDKKEMDSELLYHMTTEAAWDAVVASGEAYYPPTFVEDGYYTHATAVPKRLIFTANHFYQESPGNWICLEFTRTALRKAGIHVRDEEPLPVGDLPIAAEMTSEDWICPHIIGGLPPSCVHARYPIIRDGKTFVSIDM